MKIRIEKSIQHGQGVFALERIGAGETIIPFTGPMLTRSEIDEDGYHLQVGDDLYLGASGEADDYVNHSCDPNAGFRDGLVLVARRVIAAGEEITWDYSTAIDEEDFAGFSCQCGSELCRGTVRSFRHLDSATRERLRPWALPYLCEKYRNQSSG